MKVFCCYSKFYFFLPFVCALSRSGRYLLLPKAFVAITENKYKVFILSPVTVILCEFGKTSSYL